MQSSLRISVRKVIFTPRNVGLTKDSEFPELNSAWKASHVKMILWYVTHRACEVAKANPESIAALHSRFSLSSRGFSCNAGSRPGRSAYRPSR